MMHDCDLCGGWIVRPIPEAARFGSGGVVVCENCGFVYVPERRTPAEIAKSWDEIYGAGYTAKWPAVEARLQYVAAWFEERDTWKGKSVLEIGCGEGRFLDILVGYGVRSAHGIEPCKAHVEANHARWLAKGRVGMSVDIVHGVIEDGWSGVFLPHDVVCILWTLENCGDCIGMLKRARELLKPDGKLIVATGSRILVPFKKPLSSYFSKNAPDTHCFRWSARSLNRALWHANFMASRVNAYNECDWLVFEAKKDSSVAPLPDDPQQVLDYFRRWGEQFP